MPLLFTPVARNLNRWMRVITISFLAALLLYSPVKAGGPKCDRKDSERCVKCEGMNHKNCKNGCHIGCCGCPDGSNPEEGKCTRDLSHEDPEEGNK